MNLIGCHQADTDVVMVFVVPCEEASAECFGVLDAAEPVRELRLILQRLEMAFRERVIVGDMRSAMRLCYAEVGEQQCRCLGLHGSSAIGMQCQTTWKNTILSDRIIEQRLE